jgi:hypothetical protein
MGTKNGKWDGKGKPSTKDAAVAWAVANGATEKEAKRLIREGASMAADARRVVEIATQGVGGPTPIGGQTIPGSELRGFGGKESRRPGRVNAPREPTATTATEVQDIDQSGSVDARDVALTAALAEAGIALPDLKGFAQGGGERGEALWPFPTQGMTPEEIAAITVQNKSRRKGAVNGVVPDAQGRVGARYLASSTIVPLKWSQERRADLQRVMHGLGLYGDEKVTLGSWDEKDTDAFATILQYSNVEGLSYIETLAGWRQTGIPAELQAKIKSGAPKRPTIQVTSPLDIRKAAQETSRELIGRVDTGFAEGVVKPYQAAEAGAQGAVYGNQEAGGGGTVTQEASLGAFAEDKLRREKPLEVDGYQFLNQFQGFLSMIGAK